MRLINVIEVPWDWEARREAISPSIWVVRPQDDSDDAAPVGLRLCMSEAQQLRDELTRLLEQA